MSLFGLEQLFDGKTIFGSLALLSVHVHFWWNTRRVTRLAAAFSELADAHAGPIEHAGYLSTNRKGVTP